jgi:elongator complex protein 3
MYKLKTKMFSNKFANNYKEPDIESIFNKERFKNDIKQEELELMKRVFNESQFTDINNEKDYVKFINILSKRFNKTKIIKGYRQLVKDNEIKRNYDLEHYMKLKNTRGNSGILQVTVFTSPDYFGDRNNSKNGNCPHNCIYCPLEVDSEGKPTQPRSYLSTEPGNKRAIQNKHHPVGQIFDRLNTLEKMGHISAMPDNPVKIEFMISGGTFNYYPEDYIIWFSTMCYYALNTYYDYTLNGSMRDNFSLEAEQIINETSYIRMIGLTIETRPDMLLGLNNDFKYIRLFRQIGVTRVQIGTQHIDNTILKYIKRGCTNEDNQQGNKILMQNGFKVDNHWMLDLPSSTPKKDKEMIDYIFNCENYLVDQLKIYPTMVTPFSKIEEMFNNGEYVPYADVDITKLEDTIIYFKKHIPYFIRINRVIRDIPPESVIGGVNCPEMRQRIEKKMLENGYKCKCIRCREIKDNNFNSDDCILYVDRYKSCDGINYFISYENDQRTKLYGFIRLRFNISEKYTLPELKGHALIRELHVYGTHTGVGNKKDKKTQHRGLGKKLMSIAEDIATFEGYKHITVISGVGVKEYYRKLGYTDYHTYMTKNTKSYVMIYIAYIIVILMCMLQFVIIYVEL